jgi:LCP family protein required for cell wall assembly
MNEWPQGWFRGTPDGEEAAGPGAADPTVRLPAGSRPASGGATGAPPPGTRPAGGARPAGSARPAASGQASASQRPGGWPEQPPRSASGRGAAGGGQRVPGGQPGGGWPPAGGAAAPSRRSASGPGGPSGYQPGSGAGAPRRNSGAGTGWLRPRRIFGVLAVVVALILVGVVSMYFILNGDLHRKNVLVNYSARPAQGSGDNWLIAGSDSRQGLTTAQERKLATGFDVSGHRSDTIMILHIPSGGGKPILISLPRDSWVDIPGYGDNKINAAYDFGGPRLLAKTVQNATGLRIDHYMEVGFGGFVNVVNAVGGVHMGIKHPLRDVASGLDIEKGCQTLDGDEALAYVRDRHNFAEQDLQRVQDQRILMRALLRKMTSMGVLLNPFDAIPAATGTASTLTVDKSTSLLQLVEAAFALRHPQTTTIPIASANYVTPSGEDAVLWDRSQALELFNDLNAGRPVPGSLITGSQQGS